MGNSIDGGQERGSPELDDFHVTKPIQSKDALDLKLDQSESGIMSDFEREELNKMMNDAIVRNNKLFCYDYNFIKIFSNHQIAMDLPPDKLKIVKMLPDAKKKQFLRDLVNINIWRNFDKFQLNSIKLGPSKRKTASRILHECSQKLY